jgi:hypothetical protein
MRVAAFYETGKNLILRVASAAHRGFAMVIRRIRDHIGSHNWLAVVIDLAIVVVGVFLGAQATNWNERRIEHDQSVSFRNRLVDELDFNTHQFAEQQAYYEQVHDEALATARGLQSPGSMEDRNFLVHAYQSTQIDITAGKRFIYDEMVSSGLVDRLGNEKLQADASDYYLGIATIDRTYNEIPPYRALMRTLMPHELQAQIRERCGDLKVTSRGRVIAVRLPTTCEAQLDPAAVAVGVGRIRREPRLHDELNRYISWLNEKVGSLDESVEQTNKLRRALVAGS